MKLIFTKRNKYGAIKTVVDGITFDSKAESERYSELRLMEKGDLVRDLELQPRIFLSEAKIRYTPDFVYFDVHENKKVWEDVKGKITQDFRVRKNLWKVYGPGKLRITKKEKGFFVVSEEVDVISINEESSNKAKRKVRNKKGKRWRGRGKTNN